MRKSSKKEKIKLLKKYFEKEPQVILAFLFGSRAKEKEMRESDWDIGIYFKPKEYLELETEFDYPEEGMWSDLVDILESDNVDLVILNRARPDLVYSVLKSGVPLVIKDKGLYLDLLCKTSYEAIDWWDFVNEFWKISEKVKSLSLEAKIKIKERLKFLEVQFEDLARFQKLTWPIYRGDRNERRNVERWIENLVMPTIDIAQIFLASQKKEIPESYKDALKVFGAINLNFPLKEAEEFSEFAKMRNIVAHEYLDIKWKKIQNFIKKAEKLYPKFIKKMKKMLK